VTTFGGDAGHEREHAGPTRPAEGIRPGLAQASQGVASPGDASPDAREGILVELSAGGGLGM